METFTAVMAVLPDWLEALTLLVAAAAGVAALTPTPKDDAILGKAYKILEVVALNIGHAKERPGEKTGKAA